MDYTIANYDLFLLPYEDIIAKTKINCTLFPVAQVKMAYNFKVY